MNVKQLKDSILLRAFQGKLVEQNPKDEPASKLLERIAASRNEGENAKKKKTVSTCIYREGSCWYEQIGSAEVQDISEEIPFEIPESWEWCRLESVIELLSGQDFPPNKYSSNPKGLPYITGASNFQNNHVVLNRWTEFPSVIAKKNDILLVCKGSGYGNRIIADIEEAHIARQIMAIRVADETLRSFVYYFIGIKFDFLKSKGNGLIPGIARDVVLKMAMPLPPLAEQKRIVAKIEELMPLVEEYGKAQSSLDALNANLPTALKKSILQEAIQGRLVPQIKKEAPASALLDQIQKAKEKLVQEGKLKKKDIQTSEISDDEKPFDIPESWEWTRLSSFALMHTGNSISENEKKARYTNVKGMEYIGTKDVGFDHVIDYKNGIAIPSKYIENFKIASANSVLLCIEGGSAGRKIGVINQDVCFGNKLCCFTPYGDYLKFLYYYLQSPSFFEVFTDNKTGIIGGVSINTLKDLVVPVPPLEEQKRIVSKIEELFQQIEPLKN